MFLEFLQGHDTFVYPQNRARKLHDALVLHLYVRHLWCSLHPSAWKNKEMTQCQMLIDSCRGEVELLVVMFLHI